MKITPFFIGFFTLVASLLSCIEALAIENYLIYQDNWALVSEDRQLELNAGLATYTVKNLPATIQAESIRIEPQSSHKAKWLSQQFRYDFLDKSTLLQHLIGQWVWYKDPLAQADKKNAYKQGRLLSNPLSAAKNSANSLRNQPYLIIETETREKKIIPTSHIQFQSIPEGLHLGPSLDWQIESINEQILPYTLHYMSKGLGWKAVYNATLQPMTRQRGRVYLESWFSLNNQSGKDLRNGEVDLLAGTVNRAKQHGSYNRGYARKMMVAEAAVLNDSIGQAVAHHSVGDYYRFSLPQRVTLSTGATIQIPWLDTEALEASTQYVFDPNPGHQWFGFQQRRANHESHPNRNISRWLQFKNPAKESSQPWPYGIIRIYEQGKDGQQSFLGESHLRATPTGELVQLKLGDAFDLIGEKKQLDYFRNSQYSEASYRVELRNQSKEMVTVTVKDYPNGDWELLNASQPLSQKDQKNLHFTVDVAAKGKAALQYTIRNWHKRP